MFCDEQLTEKQLLHPLNRTRNVFSDVCPSKCECKVNRRLGKESKHQEKAAAIRASDSN